MKTLASDEWHYLILVIQAAHIITTIASILSCATYSRHAVTRIFLAADCASGTRRYAPYFGNNLPLMSVLANERAS
jgi:hypothetical protein